jgi:hypothetical protein
VRDLTQTSYGKLLLFSLRRALTTATQA